jgi:invasion protein IalB
MMATSSHEGQLSHDRDSETTNSKYPQPRWTGMMGCSTTLAASTIRVTAMQQRSQPIRYAALSGAILLSMLSGTPSLAQEAAAPQAPPPAPWGARCASEARSSALDCVVEQRVIVSNTGQLLAAVSVRIPPGEATPAMMIQTPFGLYLPAGVKVAIDGTGFGDLPLQTCDGSGCYAGQAVSPELLAALKSGVTLSITVQDAAQRDITVPVSLNGFTAAYDKIQ